MLTQRVRRRSVCLCSGVVINRRTCIRNLLSLRNYSYVTGYEQWVLLPFIAISPRRISESVGYPIRLQTAFCRSGLPKLLSDALGGANAIALG